MTKIIQLIDDIIWFIDDMILFLSIKQPIKSVERVFQFKWVKLQLDEIVKFIFALLKRLNFGIYETTFCKKKLAHLLSIYQNNYYLRYLYFSRQSISKQVRSCAVRNSFDHLKFLTFKLPWLCCISKDFLKYCSPISRI